MCTSLQFLCHFISRRNVSLKGLSESESKNIYAFWFEVKLLEHFHLSNIVWKHLKSTDLKIVRKWDLDVWAHGMCNSWVMFSTNIHQNCLGWCKRWGVMMSLVMFGNYDCLSLGNELRLKNFEVGNNFWMFQKFIFH